jgi:hypothetical protein
MYKCQVCKKAVLDYVKYWTARKDKINEYWYPVCFECDKHFKHAAYIVEAASSKNTDRQCVEL